MRARRKEQRDGTSTVFTDSVGCGGTSDCIETLQPGQSFEQELFWDQTDTRTPFFGKVPPGTYEIQGFVKEIDSNPKKLISSNKVQIQVLR